MKNKSLVQHVEKNTFNGDAAMTSEQVQKHPLRDNVKRFQDLTEESQRRARKAKNQEQLTLHVAIFPSVAALIHSGAEELKVTRIKARYSKTVHKDLSQLQGCIFKEVLTEFRKMVLVDWKVGKKVGQDKPLSLKEIFAQISLNSIPDIIIEKICFSVSYTQFNNYTLKNEDFCTEWSFEPYTFRKGFWDRLKAVNFPARKLYEEYIKQRNDLLKDLSETTRRRWRDTILTNAPHDELTNQEIRNLWGGVPYVIILKESRGNFELMDMGEWRS
jgi:hypothetical protein